jgi:hypothetical protein
LKARRRFSIDAWKSSGASWAVERENENRFFEYLFDSLVFFLFDVTIKETVERVALLSP